MIFFYYEFSQWKLIDFLLVVLLSCASNFLDARRRWDGQNVCCRAVSVDRSTISDFPSSIGHGLARLSHMNKSGRTCSNLSDGRLSFLSLLHGFGKSRRVCFTTCAKFGQFGLGSIVLAEQVYRIQAACNGRLQMKNYGNSVPGQFSLVRSPMVSRGQSWDVALCCLHVGRHSLWRNCFRAPASCNCFDHLLQSFTCLSNTALTSIFFAFFICIVSLESPGKVFRSLLPFVPSQDANIVLYVQFTFCSFT